MCILNKLFLIKTERNLCQSNDGNLSYLFTKANNEWRIFWSLILKGLVIPSYPEIIVKYYYIKTKH